MTIENTPAAVTLDEAKPEQRVNVYLELDDVNRRWIVTPGTVDGYPLDALDGPDNDLREEHWTPEIVAAMQAAETVPLPNADQLVLLLLEALPEESTVKSAMAEILDAAGSWADELTTYIAKASDEYRDEESAANQRDTAAAITAAVELLNV